jgi:hypothetical protein
MDKSDRKGVRYLLWGEPGRSPAGAGSFLGDSGWGNQRLAETVGLAVESQQVVPIES